MTQDLRRQMWFALFVLVVFAAGVAFGLGAGRLLGPGRGFGPPGRPGRGPGPPPTHVVVDRMTRDLNLTADQRQKIEVLFEANAERFEQFRGESNRRFEELRRQLNEEVERVLTPEQAAKFRSQPRERRGPPPPMREPRPRDLPPPRDPPD